MNTNTQNNQMIKGKSYLVDDSQINGKWKLIKRVKNPLKFEGFSFYKLGAYPDPFTDKTRIFKTGSGQRQDGLVIDKVVSIWDPSNIDHRNKIMFMLGHPKVKVEGITLSKEVNARKNSNYEFTLINVEQQNMQEYDDENIIDKVIGRLSLEFTEAGKKYIGLEKTQFILAHLNMSYREARYMNKTSTHTKVLKKRLKTFVRANKENALMVQSIINDMSYAKYYYQIKEMLRLGIISLSYGSYKFNNEVLGIDIDTVIEKFEQTPELYSQLETILSTKLKEEKNDVNNV